MGSKLNELNSFYFIGIGGVSMSSLAAILKSRGKTVGGYDFKESDATKQLEEMGIKINYIASQDGSLGFEAAVFTAAIKENDPEFIAAKKNCKFIFSRAELLGMITADFEHSVGVSGTHGKSTTTGMLAQIFLSFDKESTVLAGAYLPQIASSFKCGSGSLAVFEACEYKNSYHSMEPTVKVVLNCEHDHVDFFPTIDDVIASFHKFIDTKRKNSDENIAVVNLDCENSVRAANNTSASVYYYSVKEKTDYYASNVNMNGGYGEFDIYKREKKLFSVRLSVPGAHNVSNSVAAAAAADLLGIPADIIKEGLMSFHGVARRFERKGEILNKAVLIDDYAHHPDEIEATLKAAKLLGYKRIIAIFQPHTFTRTKALLKEFADALSLADIAVLAEIYSARETNTVKVSSADVAALIPNGKYFESFSEISEYIKKTVKDGDLVMTIGAGNINTLDKLLLDRKDV